MAKKRVSAELLKDRKGFWGVRITLPDGTRIDARDDPRDRQRIVYSNPQRVPDHLKKKIVPDLMRQARINNMTGK
jgi:hypothetical protein